MERDIFVQEFESFQEAWDNSKTKERFEFYQGMEQKIAYIKNAERWFVDGEGNLYYSYHTEDGVRIVKEASPISALCDSPFQYVQIMVCGEYCEKPGGGWYHKRNGKGKLRFSGQYVDRKKASELSKQALAFAFNK